MIKTAGTVLKLKFSYIRGIFFIKRVTGGRTYRRSLAPGQESLEET